MRGLAAEGEKRTHETHSLDRLVARARDNLAVVGREGHREDILLVRDEAAGGGAGVEVPEAKGSVPRARERELAVRGDGDILNVVVVAGESAARHALSTCEVPYEDGLVARTREEDVGLLHCRREAGHPVGVPLERGAKVESLSHGGGGRRERGEGVRGHGEDEERREFAGRQWRGDEEDSRFD
eukprot:scaffold187307_cov26-Tisochrysis_lutea.AAC.1